MGCTREEDETVRGCLHVEYVSACSAATRKSNTNGRILIALRDDEMEPFGSADGDATVMISFVKATKESREKKEVKLSCDCRP